MGRKEKLLERLAARTDHTGKPLKPYRESVAMIRAELSMFEENAAQALKGDKVGTDITHNG